MGRQGESVLNDLILKFNGVCDDVKTNFKSNFYLLYDSETHHEILSSNENSWEVVAPSRMLFNDLDSKEVNLFKKLYAKAHSRVRKQLRKHAKK
jgi:hypothetical protein